MERTREDILKDIVLDWRALKPRRQKRRRFKEYQEQLLKEIPGAADRTNVAMHAVIDVSTAAGETFTSGMGATTEIRNQALIHYIARLASSNNDEDEFDFSFIESLLDNGADINTCDKYGQTMFHEVARSWNVDVARFLLNKGANINAQDKYGRAPLHVAAAVDYTDMIEFLLEHKADLDITTFEEFQTPIHFAAKNDACQAIKLLINYGANVNCRDYQDRTPIQVAASMSRTKAARFLVELGVSTGVYDRNGEMALSLLILKMPEVATLAFDQFRSQDMINRKEYNFLNYIEGPRLLEKDPRANKARSPLEVAIQYEQYSIVMHPVMKRLINVKWEFFGKNGARKDLVVNFLFAFMWTILGISMPMEASQLYWPLKYTWWRCLSALATLSLTGFEFYKHVSSFVYMNRAIRRWKTFREKTLLNDKRFCHPKWRDENEYLDKEIKDAREERFFTRQDGWIFLDWIALFLVLSGIASHISFVVTGSVLSRNIHIRIVSFVLIVLYVRLLKFTRPFEGPGPFVASIAPMLRDFLKWSLLFILLFIPYASIIWMIFGPINNDTPAYLSDIPGLIFTVFSIAAFSNLSKVDDLIDIDKDMARILVASLVVISTIIILNLLIAMLADTFTRMYENSLETATMQRAKTILYLEQKISASLWKKYCEHIQNECSPEVGRLSEEMCAGRRDKNRAKEKFQSNVEEIHTIMTERFSHKVGSEKSDMDQLMMEVKQIKEFVTNDRYSNIHGFARPANPVNLNIILEHKPGGGLNSHAPNEKNDKHFDRKERRKNHENGQFTAKCFGKVLTLPKHKAEKFLGVNSSNTSPKIIECGSQASGVSIEQIKQQLDVILSLVAHGIKVGRLNFNINEKVFDGTVSPNNESIQPLLDSDSGSVKIEKNVDMTMGIHASPTKGLSSTSLSSQSSANDILQGSLELYTSGGKVGSQRISTQSTQGHGSLDLCTSGDVNGNSFKGSQSSPSQGTEGHSSLDLCTSGDVNGNSLAESQWISSLGMEVRHEVNSLLSTSSSEGSTTCGDKVYDSDQIDPVGHSSDKMSHKSSEPASEFIKKFRPTQWRLKTLNSNFPSGVVHSSYSDFDNTSISNSSNSQNNSSNGSSQSSIPEHLFVNESHQDDVINIRTFELTQSSSSERGCTTPASPSVQRVPRVCWADTVSGPTSKPFLNIREISTSPSNLSSEAQIESDTSGDDEEQSNTEMDMKSKCHV